MPTPRNQIEQDLLALLQEEQKRNGSVVQTKVAASRPGAMGADSYLNFLQPPSPGRNVAEVSLDSLWERPPVVTASQEPDALSALFQSPAPPASSEPDLSALWNTTPGSETELESLWETPFTASSSDGSDGLSALFMNGDAIAQADLTNQYEALTHLAQDLPTRPRVASSDFNIEFDSEMNFDAPIRGGGSAQRFRIDRPPPHQPFNRSVAAQDGVVVGQRGSDGRFQRTAAVTAPRPSREVRVPASVPSRPEPAPRPSSFTKYDLLRKGGLDI